MMGIDASGNASIQVTIVDCGLKSALIIGSVKIVLFRAIIPSIVVESYSSIW
jgi:hypothetical protein